MYFFVYMGQDSSVPLDHAFIKKEVENFLVELCKQEKLTKHTKDMLLSNFSNKLKPQGGLFSKKIAPVLTSQEDVYTILSDLYIGGHGNRFDSAASFIQAYKDYKQQEHIQIQVQEADGVLQKLLTHMETHTQQVKDDTEYVPASFDEMQRDKKFEKKIKSLFFDLLQKLLVLFTVNSSVKYVDNEDLIDDQMSLDDIQKQFAMQDRLTALTDGLSKKEKDKYTKLKNILDERDEKKVTGYQQYITQRVDELNNDIGLVKHRLEETEKLIASLPTNKEFAATYGKVEGVGIEYFQQMEKCQQQQQEDTEYLQLYTHEIADMKYIQDGLQSYLGYKQLGEQCLQGCIDVSVQLETITEQDPDIEDMSSITLLKEAESEIMELGTLLDLAGKAIDGYLSRSWQDDNTAAYFIKIYTQLQGVIAQRQEEQKHVMKDIHTALEKTILPLEREIQSLKAYLHSVTILSSAQEIINYYDQVPAYMKRVEGAISLTEKIGSDALGKQAKQLSSIYRKLQDMIDPTLLMYTHVDEIYDKKLSEYPGEAIAKMKTEIDITKQAEKKSREHLIMCNHVRLFGSELYKKEASSGGKALTMFWYASRVYIISDDTSSFYDKLFSCTYEEIFSLDLSQAMFTDMNGLERTLNISQTVGLPIDLLLDNMIKSQSIGLEKVFTSNRRTARYQYILKNLKQRFSDEYIIQYYIAIYTPEQLKALLKYYKGDTFISFHLQRVWFSIDLSEEKAINELQKIGYSATSVFKLLKRLGGGTNDTLLRDDILRKLHVGGYGKYALVGTIKELYTKSWHEATDIVEAMYQKIKSEESTT